MKVQARYYEKLNNGMVKCTLCPHYCEIDDGGMGICNNRINENGILYTLYYGMISGYGYDNIEKKPIVAYKPGEVIFSIGGYGCNLRCQFCQNHSIVYDDGFMRDVDMDLLVDMAGRNGSIGMAYTYNEPTIWYEMMYDLARKIKDKGMDNILVTNGYINKKPLLEILPYIDAINIDLKSCDDTFYKKICKGSLHAVIETIKTASQLTHVELTTLIIDDDNSSDEHIERLGDMVAEIDRGIPLHISRYFPAYKYRKPPTKVETLLRAKNILSRKLDRVIIGNVPGIR